MRTSAGHLKYRKSTRKGCRDVTVYARVWLPDGRRVTRAIGKLWPEKSKPPEGWFTKRSAAKELREILVEADRGLWPKDVQRRNGGAPTFGDAVDAWLEYAERERGVKASTWRDYRNLGDQLVTVFGDGTPLDAITTETVEAHKARLLAAGKSARTVTKHLTALGSIYRRAGRVWGVTSPVADVEKPRVRSSGDYDVLGPDEVRLVARAAESEQDGALYLTAALTGLRQSELLGLTWADVAFDTRRVHVRRAVVQGAVTTPKSGKVRSVPMVDEVARALDGLSRRERFTDDDDLVFPSADGSHQDGSAVTRRFRSALARAGLPRLRFHDLRHTAATLFVQAWPVTDAQMYLGHANVQTTMRYVHATDASDAADRLERALAERSAVPQVARIRPDAADGSSPDEARRAA
jgi:integrase